MITGGCMCRAVRYQTEVEPIITRLCWCRVCQYIAAGNAAVGVCFPSAGMSIQGETRDFVSIARNTLRQGSRCGTGRGRGPLKHETCYRPMRDGRVEV
jgi:hypothetical protein